MTIQCFSIRNFAYDTQETYIFDTYCYFVIYQQFLRGYFPALQQHATVSQKYIYRLRFFASVTHSNGPLGKQVLSSVGSKGHVGRL